MRKWYLITVVLVAMLLNMPFSAEANLFSNPGFETGAGSPDDWWSGGSGWTDYKDDGPHSGSKYVAAGGGSGAYSYWGQNVSGVASGLTYSFSAWLKTEGWGSPSGILQVEFKDSGNNTLRTDNLEVLSGIDETWSLRNMTTDPAPSGATNANFILSAKGDGTILFDDAQVIKLF